MASGAGSGGAEDRESDGSHAVASEGLYCVVATSRHRNLTCVDTSLPADLKLHAHSRAQSQGVAVIVTRRPIEQVTTLSTHGPRVHVLGVRIHCEASGLGRTLLQVLVLVHVQSIPGERGLARAVDAGFHRLCAGGLSKLKGNVQRVPMPRCSSARCDFAHITSGGQVVTIGSTMQQIRVVRSPGVPLIDGQSFACEWMEDCQMNRWLLKARLAEAITAYGPESHWIDRRTVERSEQLASA